MRKWNRFCVHAPKMRSPSGNKDGRVSPSSLCHWLCESNRSEILFSGSGRGAQRTVCVTLVVDCLTEKWLIEIAHKCCCCSHWRYEAIWTLNRILESTENDFCSLFPLWHLIRDHLLPWVSVYFMGIETWDETGCYLSHKTFFYPYEWTGEEGVSITMGGSWIHQFPGITDRVHSHRGPL